jgi:YggT family protein
MGNSAVGAIVFIINSIAQLYILVLLLRLLMPFLHIPFNNPLAQGILRLTSPLVLPVRRLLPPIGRLDTATLAVAFGIQYLTLLLTMLLYRHAPAILPIALTTLIDLVILTIRLFVFAIIVRVILSWFGGSGAYNPAIALIDRLTEPVLRPFRRVIPPIGGIDISPAIAIILLIALTILIAGLKPLPFYP